MDNDCSHWNETKALPTKCNCNSGTELDYSWKLSVKRKFEGSNLECNHSCDENLISAEKCTWRVAEDVASENIQWDQFNKKCNDTLSNDSPTQPTEFLKMQNHAGKRVREPED